MSTSLSSLIKLQNKKLNFYSNKQFLSLFQDKSTALSDIDLHDDLDDSSSNYPKENYHEYKSYNSNILIISSNSSTDGMAQLIINSSCLGSTFCE